MADITDGEIGSTIQERRNTLGMSQGDLAREIKAAGLNWSQGTLSKVEAGVRPVRLSEAPTLANVLNLSVRELLEPVDALRNVMIRLSAEKGEIGQRLQQEQRAWDHIDAAFTALRTLARRANGSDDESNLSLNLLVNFAFGNLQLHEVVAILEQLGVAREDMEPHLPKAFANSPSARSANPSPGFIRAVQPLLLSAAPQLGSPSPDPGVADTMEQPEV